MYCLINEQECFIRFKTTRAQPTSLLNRFKNEPRNNGHKDLQGIEHVCQFAKLSRNYHIYGINLRCGLRYTDFSAWLYDIYEGTMASKRKFREAKSAEEGEKMFVNAIASQHVL